MKNKIFLGLSLINVFLMHTWPPALQNCGNTCFLNATLQAMYNIEPLSDILYKANNPYDKSITPVGYYYVELVKQITNTKNPTSPVDFTCTTGQALYELDQNAFNLLKAPSCSQQDATEFMGAFLDLLIEKGASLKDSIKNIFTFDLVSTVKCPVNLSFNLTELESITTDKDHTHLFVETQNLQNQPLTTLKQCLENYFTKESISSYRDETNNVYRDDCTKQLQLRNPPKILIIALKRFEFETKGKEKKLNHRINIPFELDITDFVKDSSNPLENTFELIGVIVQGGGASGGHYWAYVKDETGQWFNCNDSSITQVSITDSSVINNIEGSGSTTGYGFIYQKKLPNPLTELKNELDKLTNSLKAIFP